MNNGSAPDGQPIMSSIDHEEFVRVWNTARTRHDVARHFNIPVTTASNIAGTLRQFGKELLFFKSSGRGHYLPGQGPRNVHYGQHIGTRCIRCRRIQEAHAVGLASMNAQVTPGVIDLGRGKNPQPTQRSEPEGNVVNQRLVHEDTDHGHIVVNTSRGPVNCVSPEDVRDIGASDGPAVRDWVIIRKPSKEMGDAITRVLVPLRDGKSPIAMRLADAMRVEQAVNPVHPFFSIPKGKVTVADIDARLAALRKKHLQSPDRQLDEAEADEVASLRRRRQFLLAQTRYLLGGLFSDDPEGDDE